jgi:hypothetical protein
MVASNLKMNGIAVTVTRADLSRELRQMLDKQIAKTHRRIRKYENDHNEKMADCMDWYAEGIEYAVACLIDLDEVHALHTVRQGGE